MLNPSLAVNAPPDLATQRLSRVDGCPECAANTETPHTVEPTLHGFTAFYRCSDCEHVWYTSWRDA